MAGSVYIHRDYEDRLDDGLGLARARIPAAFAYTVVKFNRRTGSYSFIASPDFDTNPEPVAGDIWTVSASVEAKFRAQLIDPYIYHHKWLMVADNYKGFDIRGSQQRSRLWLALSDIDKSRIGRQAYWRQHVLPRLTPDHAA